MISRRKLIAAGGAAIAASLAGCSTKKPELETSSCETEVTGDTGVAIAHGRVGWTNGQDENSVDQVTATTRFLDGEDNVLEVREDEVYNLDSSSGWSFTVIWEDDPEDIEKVQGCEVDIDY